MDFSASTFWWVAAGVLVVAELTTGTFYLLMVALGLAAGAVAAHLGASPATQVTAAALLGIVTTLAWHKSRANHPPSLPASENMDVNLDIGDRVDVLAWAADGTTSVTHRGAPWRARRAAGAPLMAGAHRIAAIEGNWLILTPMVSPT